MLGEYDFSRGVHGKYAAKFAAGSNLVLLDPEVAKAFPDSESVNESLKALARIIQRQKAIGTK